MSRHILVTAGATRNPVDAMRFVGAYSSGQTGVEIARRLAAGGGRVLLMGSPEALLRGPELSGEEFGSTSDLMTRMERWVRGNPGGVVIHAAAVGDYEGTPQAGKISSDHDELVITMKRAPKIADYVRIWDEDSVLVTFKAAGPGTRPEELVGICRRQLERTGSAFVFGNVIGSLSSTTTIVDAAAHRHFPDRGEAVSELVRRVLGA